MAKEAKKTRAQLAAEKAELIAKANGLGIDTAGKNVTQLRNAIEQATLGGDGHKPLGGDAGVKPGKDHTLAHVHSANGEHIRTYSLADHGKAFCDLANQFASKEEGRVVTTE